MINRKKQKEKFLEDYFSLCLEHGFCVDWTYGDDEDTVELFVSDSPNYVCPKGWFNHWEDIKKELRESI